MLRVHSLLYYCTVSSLGSMIRSNKESYQSQGFPHIKDIDAAALKGALDHCARFWPEMEAINTCGWNLKRAEEASVGELGVDCKPDRDQRLACLRDWKSWVSKPYDEQRGASEVPFDRRGRCYLDQSQVAWTVSQSVWQKDQPESHAKEGRAVACLGHHGKDRRAYVHTTPTRPYLPWKSASIKRV